MILYAGSSASARKVAEYGGNTYGFGSRSVLGTGWPTDQVHSTTIFTQIDWFGSITWVPPIFGGRLELSYIRQKHLDYLMVGF